MVKSTIINVPDCTANTHRWYKDADGARVCVICGVKIVVFVREESG